MKKLIMKSLSLMAFATATVAISGALTSCVNEWPKTQNLQYGITLNVHCDTDWLPDYEMNYTRLDYSDIQVKYIFQVFEKGKTDNPIREFTYFSYDLNRPDFQLHLDLYPGDYDVYAWSDIADGATGTSIFYETENFARISYTLPYIGDTNYKDAFRGQTNFTIDETMYADPNASTDITLSRPLARYMFVATDLESFIDEEITRGKLRGVFMRGDAGYRAELTGALATYSVKVVYPMYMPSVFDNYLNRPVDSWTGMYYNADIQVISDSEAIVGLDYVMMNGNDSFVQVALQIYDEDNELLAGTGTINVPTLRDRTTIVYGKFLTANENTGVTINPDFEGQFNIEYK